MREMKSLYISLFLLAVLLLLGISYMHPLFQGFAVQNSAFNLEIEIPSAYSTVEDGSTIHFTTKILNLASENRMDVSLRYEIIDESGEVIISKTETMAIETQASFVGSLGIPEGVAEGDYDLHVVLLVNGIEEAEGRGSFSIMKEEDKTMYYTYVIIISIISLVLIIYFMSRSKVILEKFRTRSKIHSMVKEKLGK